jgi:hypothetical protein
MSFDSSRLIFIVGHYKSGSTWLLNMLSLHPAIRGVQETHIFHHLRQTADLRTCARTLYTSVPWSGGGLRQLPRHVFLAQFGRFLRGRPLLSLPPRDRPITRLDLPLRSQLVLRRKLGSSCSTHEFCWCFFSFLWSDLQPERYLLEKTPGHVHYIDDIVWIFPQARLLAIHRDGRDVVVSDRSFRKFYQRAPTWSLRQSILGWRAEMEAEFRAREHSNLYVLSYEELIGNGRQILRSLLDHLELPTSDDVVEEMLRRSSFHFRSGRQPGQEKLRSFFRKGIVGDWQDQFGREEKSVFKELAGDLLIELGYESGYDW